MDIPQFSDGRIIDDTPVGGDPRELPVEKPKVEDNPGDKVLDNVKTGGELLLGAVAAWALYRRRREIKDMFGRAIDNRVRSLYLDDTAPEVEDLKRALSLMGRFIYGNPASTAPFGPEAVSTRSLQTQVKGLPDELTKSDWRAIKNYASQQVSGDLIPAVEKELDGLQSRWQRIKRVAAGVDADLVKK